MMVVIAYDVDMTTADGAKRLRRVAGLCEKFGVRVQNSVFELIIDAAKLEVVKTSLERLIEPELDSVRIYKLGSHYESKITFLGKKPRLEQDGSLIL